MGSLGRRIPWAYFALLLYAVTALTANVLGFVATLPLLDEVGYADTYTLYDAREYAHTGRLYRAAADAPYNPTLYSPLFYLVLSLPFRVSEASNPFLAPRLIVGGFFAACVLVSVSLTGALGRHRSVVAWSALLGLSILLFGPWLSMLRADFMAVLFGLLSVRLLLTQSRWTAILAGLAAGTAFAFKLTLVAAALSGFIWLLVGRRYRSSAEFLAGAVVTGAGGYLIFWPFEPHMFTHMLALRSPLTDYFGFARLVYVLMSEPVSLLALSALPLVLRRPGRKWQLLLMYGVISFLAGLAGGLTPGATVNHFFEALLIAVPLASIAAVRLCRSKNLGQVPQIFLAGLILAFLGKPAIVAARGSLTTELATRNVEWVALGHLLKDKRVFSTVPLVAFLTRTPPVTQPFVISLLELGGTFDTGPLSDRIRAREFDLVVTGARDDKVRGIQLLSPSFRRAIRSAYAPFCVMEEQLYHLPSDQRDSGSLGPGLGALGCRPIRDIQDAFLVNW